MTAPESNPDASRVGLTREVAHQKCVVVLRATREDNGDLLDVVFDPAGWLWILEEDRSYLDVEPDLGNLKAVHQLKVGGPGSRWRHFKGGFYTWVGVAAEPTSGTAFIIYRNKEGRAWARKTTSWFERVLLPAGHDWPRFYEIASST